MNWVDILFSLGVLVLSIWLVFKLINYLAVFFRARGIRNKKISLPPKLQKLLQEKKVLVLYFSSPFSEKGRNNMGPVMKVVDEEYGNVIKFNLVKDKQDAERFKVITAPTIVIIDKEGIVRYYKVGFVPYPSIKSVIDRYLKQ
ncbi:MAG: thioredoxin family protein [Brevinematia bacterium]